MKTTNLFLTALALLTSVPALAYFRCDAVGPTHAADGQWGGWCHHVATSSGWGANRNDALNAAMGSCRSEHESGCKLVNCEKCSTNWVDPQGEPHCTYVWLEDIGEIN